MDCKASDQNSIPQRFRTVPLNAIDLHEISVAQLQQHYEAGHFCSVEYVAWCLERIRSLNPYLEAVIESNPDALNIAAQLDTERQSGHVRGSLHGVPVLVKDNMATKDKMQTTAGSWALLGSTVPRDAFVVSLLRKAGAVIIGHANMGEWASARSKDYSSGYSARGGQARNPFDLSITPYGSSSGSAVSVSANIVPIAFGTETDTSIVGLSIVNGVVGIKPTVGLTSRSGIIPVSENLDTVGPFGRTVADAVHGLNAIVGQDLDDSFTLVPGRRVTKDYSVFLSKKAALKGARFGLPQKRCWEFVTGYQRNLAIRVFDAIQTCGAEMIAVNFPSVEDRISNDGKWNWELGEPHRSEWTVVKVDAYNGINRYLSSLQDTKIKDIKDIIEYNEQNRGTEGAEAGDLPAFASGQDNFKEIQATRGERNEVYQNALKHIQTACRKDGIDAAFKHTLHNGEQVELDALLMCDRRGVGQQMAAQAGYPIISIPIGLDEDGIPVSLSIHHKAWQEDTLVKWASAIEDLAQSSIGHRPCPTYKNCSSKNIPPRKV